MIYSRAIYSQLAKGKLIYPMGAQIMNTTPATPEYLLLETGNYLLLETGDKLKLESSS